MGLYKILEEYSNIPVPSGKEYLISETIKKHLKKSVDKCWTDEMGNIYALKKGEKQGTIMFSAHQDKIVSSNFLGTTTGKDADGYKINVSSGLLSRSLRMLKGNKFVLINNEFVKTKIRLSGTIFQRTRKRLKQANYQMRINGVLEELNILTSSISDPSVNQQIQNPGEPQIEIIRRELIDLTEEFVEYLSNELRIKTENGIEIKPKTKIYSWPPFKKENGFVEGKLDDAMGLALITHLNQNINPVNSPDILTVFTVSEEPGGHGARFSSKYINSLDISEKPNRIIVIDTTMFGKPGKGPVLYKSCGGGKFNPEFVGEIIEIAREVRIPLKPTDPCTFNDSAFFAEQTGIPTVAIEVPILGMHSNKETIRVKDMENTRKLLKAYLENYENKKISGPAFEIVKDCDVFK